MTTTLCFFFPGDKSWQGNNDFDEALPLWDNESVLSDQYDDQYVHNDVEDLDGLVSQPRRVCFCFIFLYFLLKDLSQSCYSFVCSVSPYPFFLYDNCIY
jgi:hypothetical protein